MLFIASTQLVAQQVPVTDSALAFEVASVRPSPPTDSTPVVWARPQPGGRWTASQADISYIVSQVYGYELPGQIVGLPDWAIRARFDINAKAEGDPPPATLKLMAQRLLADRFKLRFHIERRPSEVYVLIPARSDGKLGAGITPPVVDCEAWAAARARGAVPDPLPQLRDRPACGVRTVRNGPIMRLAIGGMPAETLADFIQGFLRNAAGLTTRMPVLDRTGLKGRFDVELEFLQMAPTLSVDGGAAPAGQTIFDAVRDQLGLILEKRTEPIDVFVIDHVEMPTAD